MGYGSSGEAAFLMPLQIRLHRGIRILEFISSPLASYGHLLCSPWCFSNTGKQWFENHLQTIFKLCEPYDLIVLRDMPLVYNGTVHPLASHFNLRGANTALTGKLTGNLDEFVASKRSADSRKNIRWKDSKLAQAGDLRFDSSLTGEALLEAADELFLDQGRRLREAGVRDPFGPAQREFFHRLLTSDDRNSRFNVLRLSVGGQGLSSILAGFHGDTCSDMMTSLASSPMRKYSPGDLVLRKLIGLCCERGFSHLDLGIGDHDYKRHWAEDEIQLFHLVKGGSFKGVIAAASVYAMQSITRLIKGNKILRSWFNVLRRYFRGTRN